MSFSSPTSSKYPALSAEVGACPIIDNHAHNILREARKSDFPLEQLTTEASGDALGDGLYSIPHMRAVRQLAHFYECEPVWEAVKKARTERPYEELCRVSFERAGIHSLLLDDGLGRIDELCEDIAWHDRLTPTCAYCCVCIN